jgi:YD repeat-containing protein
MDRLAQRMDPDGEVLTVAYGPHGWPTALTGWGAYAGNAAYNAAGQLTTLTLFGGGSLQRAYDPRTLRVVRIQGPGLDLGYAYDPAGNVRRITDTARSEVWAFAYDELDRLVGMSGPVSGTWTLDEGGGGCGGRREEPRGLTTMGIPRRRPSRRGPIGCICLW